MTEPIEMYPEPVDHIWTVEDVGRRNGDVALTFTLKSPAIPDNAYQYRLEIIGKGDCSVLNGFDNGMRRGVTVFPVLTGGEVKPGDRARFRL